MLTCAFCGRENEAESKHCQDCGKPLSPSAARVVPAVRAGSAGPAAQLAATPRASGATLTCPSCARLIGAALPFCPLCGKPTGFNLSTGPSCKICGSGYRMGDKFCARCGTKTDAPIDTAATVAVGGQTAVFSTKNVVAGPRLALLAEDGEVMQTFTLDRPETSLGRNDGDIRFSEDVFLSPLHAQISHRDGKLYVRDLGSRNGTWFFIDAPHRLMDGDVMLIGSQLLRFRRLGYPGPHPPEADQTRRLGSLIPNADVAVLAQLRGDGSVRDSLHLSPGRNVRVGRENGDWVFPYDQTMSGRHAEVNSQDSDFYVQDAGSRNGVAIAVRGERPLSKGGRFLLGDQMLRVESL